MKTFAEFIKEYENPVAFQLFQKKDGSWHKTVDVDNHGELPPSSVPATDSEIEAWKKLCENK